MNIVFWLAVILAAAAIWWLASPAFKRIGSAAKYYAKDLKEELNKDEKEIEE